MTTRVALVTGASSGIGESAVRQLLERGFIVYAAARRADRLAALKPLGARPLPMDVTDEAAMANGIATILNETGRIDALVNNAGYGAYGALEDVPFDEGRKQVEVNLFGPARLMQLVLPSMRAQGSGTIVNITSIGGKIYGPFGSWYHATKFALEGMSDALRVEVAPFGVRVVVVEPGAIRTEWSDIARENLLATSGDTAYGAYARAVKDVLEAADRPDKASHPDVVGRTIADAITSANPRPRYAVGAGASSAIFGRRLLSDRALDRVISQRMGASNAVPDTRR
ncbi:SDR family NAD(P)-dependent oxidoreductase [Agromyces protaetiae]|uniref:SDR family NAD(P)-dependent oxidoreductase n=1 Tax=Agromyces protaetiae TaxID=2509455 RepID=A0A4P6FE91_9MICO|nr:oxidoreductase [Agromyces protaetiae]QAY74244.1 SDR family NAD(P)-dependent oxidoreductase [Agromyces protaetiae]